jgi:hypothetical protein
MTERARRLAGVRGERRRVRWCADEREGSEKRDGAPMRERDQRREMVRDRSREKR